jgi:hypothetical protein
LFYILFIYLESLFNKLQMKTKKFTLAIIIACGAILYSCYSHNWDNMQPTKTNTLPPSCVIPAVVSYSANIAPIINASCGVVGSPNCHNGSHGSTSGYDLSTWSGVNGQATASPATNSPMYLAITWAAGTNGMPQTGNRLTSCQINTILQWAQAGCPNN